MTKFFYITVLLFVLTNCKQPADKVGVCCDQTYASAEDAIKCFSETTDGNGTSADERLLLIVFVDKNLEAAQRSGWDIMQDPDLIKKAKRNYALVITDVEHYKLPDTDCASDMADCIRRNSGTTFFVIANQVKCRITEWTPDNAKEDIIEKLGIGSGP